MWAGVVDKVRNYVVQIETPNGGGTGFLCAYYGGDVVAFATSAHVIQDADTWQQPVRLTHYASGEHVTLTEDTRAIIIDGNRDSAVVLMADGWKKLPQRPLRLVAAKKLARVGGEVGWLGFPALVDSRLCFFHGRISAVIEGDGSYLIDGTTIHGVSGGPVFALGPDGEPELLGTVSAHIANAVEGDVVGLLHARDLTTLHEALAATRSLGDAKRRKANVLRGGKMKH